MSSATIIAPVRQESAEKTPRRLILPALLLLYLLIWATTGAHFMADTNVYVQSILEHQHGIDSRSHLLTSNPFWDFGHILWRPLGWICFAMLKPVTQGLAHGNERAEVILTLIGINFGAALAGVYFFFRLVRRITGSDWAAMVATVGLFSADAFLNYAHSGSSYVVGLAFLITGMYLSLASCENPSIAFDFLAGLMFALAVLFWLPYVFVLPGALAAPLLLRKHDRDNWIHMGRAVIVCAVAGLAVYGMAAAAVQIGNVSALKEWILSSGHGQVQAGGVRPLARLAFSVPRSFINTARDGMWFKRYLVHDPYAPTTVRDLLRLSLWKLALFYTSTSVICVELFRSRAGRNVLFLMTFAILPIFVFALFIFEAGSIERYLPLYPFVFLGFAYVLHSKNAKSHSKYFLSLALLIMAVVNINSMRKSKLEELDRQGSARVHDLAPLLRPNSLVAAVNEQDSLAEFRQNFPLDEINLQAQWRTYDMLEINAARLQTWRQDFAKLALATWQSGGEVWLPERVFAAKPKPEWSWVEGDDKRIQWSDLPAFFSQFDAGAIFGGEDGFVLLQRDARNQKVLTQWSDK